MPFLYSLGQHSALEATQEELREDEVVSAFLDNIYVVTPDPHRIGPIYTTLQQHLYSYARIRVRGGKTQVWNRAGIRPRGCEALDRIAQLSDPDARVWRGGGDTDVLPSRHFFGRSCVHPGPFGDEGNGTTHIVGQDPVQDTRRQHLGLCHLFNVNPDQREDIRSSAHLPLVLGGGGLRSASRISASAYRACWADCLPMFARHRGVASAIVAQLERHPDTPFWEASAGARSLVGTVGCDPPPPPPSTSKPS